jgi:zinc-binding alcohol dehydrogenase family protein
MLLPMLRGLGRDRHGRILRILGEMADAGKLRPLLDDSRFTLETAPDAHRRLETGKAQGKVVIDIASDQRVVSWSKPWPKSSSASSWGMRPVDHVALMGLENTGFAIANELLWIDPIDYKDGLALAERLRRKADRIDPTRVSRPRDRLGRGAPA